MKKVVVLALMTTCLVACKRKKEDILTRKWQAVSIQNADMDIMMKQQQMFIDTVGKNTDPAANIIQYGTENIDSLRKELQVQLDSFKIMQDAAIKSTQFNFLKGGKALINFGLGEVDSASWHFENDSTLILDAMKMKGPDDKIRMHVVMLTDTMMQLQLNEQNAKSTVSFKPSEK